MTGRGIACPSPEAGAFLVRLMLDHGYVCPRLLPRGRYAALSPFGFFTALVVGDMGNPHAYADRWDYRVALGAQAALRAWDGEGDPPGPWFRHPGSGRRVSESADEMDGEGRRVGAVGVRYVRQ